ncbi:MAG: hypothetical protein KAI97_05520 [Gemmatimonadetes bacterium]|nr:hypothetical protein [Gemmatimonadota bacterium]
MIAFADADFVGMSQSDAGVLVVTAIAGVETEGDRRYSDEPELTIVRR